MRSSAQRLAKKHQSGGVDLPMDNDAINALGVAANPGSIVGQLRDHEDR